MIINVEMAPSNDALIVHPPEDVEGMQFKSSDDITRGHEPKTFLSLGKKSDKKKQKTIWREYNKVVNSAHQKFYASLVKHYHFTLAVISNKPFAEFSSASVPRGVILVCNEIFEKYAACFAHQGLLIKYNGEYPNQSSKKRAVEKLAEQDKVFEDEEELMDEDTIDEEEDFMDEEEVE